MTIKKNINYIVKYNEVDKFLNEKSLIEFNKKSNIREVDFSPKINICKEHKNLSLVITLMKTTYDGYYSFFGAVADFSKSIKDIENSWNEVFKGLPYIKYTPDIVIKYFNKG